MSEEDDGLACEEKNLPGGINQLKKMMDLALENGELRTPHTPVPEEMLPGGPVPHMMLSESSHGPATGRLSPGISPRTPGGSSSIDRALKDFQV